MNAFRQWIVIAVILANGYSLGANTVERFVNYQTWALIPVEAFQAYHKAQAPLIRLFIVAPLGIGFFLQLLLLTFRRQANLSAAIVWTMIVASAVGAISTVMIQLPIHLRLDANGYSPALLDRLLSTDWIRKAADLTRLIATLLLAKTLIRSL